MTKIQLSVCASLIFIIVPIKAISAVYKCIDTNGTMSFQGHPCAQDESNVKLDRSVAIAVADKRPKLYSDVPLISSIKPDCHRQSKHNEKVCFCNTQQYYMIGKGNSGLNYSMKQLPIHWNAYNDMLKEYKTLSGSSKTSQYEALNLQACKILMVQRRISTQYDNAIAKLENKIQRSAGHEGRVVRAANHLTELKELAENIGMETN